MVIHTNENGLLDLDRSDTHIHNNEAKRCKVNNDSATYLWHCRLGHIGVKRMKKLHVDGCLESLDFESLDTCEPCLMGRMTKTPFSGTMKRASDLLEIMHADACDPMRIEACGGNHARRSVRLTQLQAELIYHVKRLKMHPIHSISS